MNLRTKRFKRTTAVMKRRRMKKLRTKRIITMLNKTLLQRKVKPSKFKRKTLKGMRTLKRTTSVMKGASTRRITTMLN